MRAALPGSSAHDCGAPRCRSYRYLAAVLALAAFPVGCKASVRGEAKASASGGDDDEVADYDRPLEQPMSSYETDDPQSTEGQALLGARHDVTYKGPPTAKCECMVAALGAPSDAAFEWATAPPATDMNQLVIAISTAGQSCPGAPKDALGPSYWGYQIHGNDVVVMVENAVLGRPITTGAIIPKPAADGQVYVRPLGKAIPYGRGLDGTSQCKLGNPGPPRAAPPRREIEPPNDGTMTSEVPPID